VGGPAADLETANAHKTEQDHWAKLAINAAAQINS
jgi:hypothetical protein